MSESARWPESSPVVPTLKLESWKEIAAYLKRGVRTVRRWEREEGLPVHRQMHRKLASVYADAAEIDRWRGSRTADGAQRASGILRAAAALGSEKRTIAVLPFQNLSGDVEQDFVADGLTEELINQLGRVNPRTLGVIARTTAMQCRVENKTIDQIAIELGVHWVIEGSVRCEGGRVRATAQLIHARDQVQVWSGTYEQAMISMLVLQRELASDLVREIRVSVAPGRGVTVRDEAALSDAYCSYLKGRHLLARFTPGAIRASVTAFRQAIDADPVFAPPYAGLAEAYDRLPMWIDQSPSSVLPMALEAAEHALRLDAHLPEAHASLAVVHANYLWDWPKAERHFQRALELNPGCSPARLWYTEFLAEMGRPDEALAIIDRARVEDPLSSAVHTTRAFALLMARRYADAITELGQVLDVDPGYPMALIRLGLAHTFSGRQDEGIRVLQFAADHAPDLLDCRSLLGYALAVAGRRAEAERQLTRLRELAAERYAPRSCSPTFISGSASTTKPSRASSGNTMPEAGTCC